MNKEEYIVSGLLELYVAGALSEKENQEVWVAMQKFPEVLKEIQDIEAAVMKLTAAVAPQASPSFTTIKKRISIDAPETKVISIEPSRTNWFKYTGWAAALLFGAALLWQLKTGDDIENQLKSVEVKQGVLEAEIESTRNNLNEANAFIDVLRDRDIITVPLGGQAISPSAYAQVYWDKKNNTVYLDANGLPEPPPGKAYQFWSLTLNPLTPTDMGVLENFMEDTDKIFKIRNPNASEAFGITLEPAGGSPSPTLEQLYTLGVVEKSS